MNPGQEPHQIPPKPPDITKNFASLFKKPSNIENFLKFPTASEMNSVTLVDTLGCNFTKPMPPNPPLNQNQSNAQFTSSSMFPSTVRTSANNMLPSSELGIQVPLASSNIQNTNGVSLKPQSSLNFQVHSSSQVPSTDRTLPNSQIPLSGQGTQVPVVISGVQNDHGVQIPPANISFGSFISATSSKSAKRVVFNNVHWSPDETQELSRGFNLTLKGKCAYGKPSLGVVKEFINSRWLLKGEFIVGVLDPRHILIRFSLYEDYVKVWLKDTTYIEGFL
ncbi:unnamed protein product, partial [Ilex paraguariensis]